MWRAAALTTVGALAFAAAAAAAPPLRPISRAVTPAVSDGTRYVAIARTDRSTIVYDTRTGARWRIATPVCPPHVVGGFAYPQGRGQLTAIGGGELLWNCHADFADVSRPFVAPLHGGTPAIPPGAASVFEQSASDDLLPYLRIGTQWIYGQQRGYHFTTDEFLNWHTAQVLRNLPARATQYADLDSPALAAPLCAPLQRVATPGDAADNSPPFYDVQVDGRLMLSVGPRLALYRCGRAKAVFAARCGCTNPQLGADLVTWSDETLVRAYQPATGRIWRWSIPKSNVAVSHVRGRVIVSRQRGASSTWLVSVARLTSRARAGR